MYQNRKVINAEGDGCVTFQKKRGDTLMHMYNILYLLYSSGAKSKLVAATQRQIQETLARDSDKMCDRTIYNNIRKLAKLGYIAEGLLHGNAKSYYITAEGIAWMKETEAEVNG